MLATDMESQLSSAARSLGDFSGQVPQRRAKRTELSSHLELVFTAAPIGIGIRACRFESKVARNEPERPPHSIDDIGFVPRTPAVDSGTFRDSNERHAAKQPAAS